VVERGHLGDHPAHSDARQVRRPVVESAGERCGVGREIAQRVRRRIRIDGGRSASCCAFVVRVSGGTFGSLISVASFEIVARAGNNRR
jgi:hypothetical protein